jgi:hypothetical protein
MSNLYNGPSIYASYQISDQLAFWFQRRRLKCEKLSVDGRQLMAKAHHQKSNQNQFRSIYLCKCKRSLNEMDKSGYFPEEKHLKKISTLIELLSNQST